MTIASDFLERLRPGGPWVLTAIKPDGPTETITATSAREVDAFVGKHDGKRNLYYSLNPTRGPMTKKASKKDMDASEYLPADLDPNDDEKPEVAKERMLAKISAHPIQPTAVVDSGNGIQALWKLEKPVKLDTPEIIADVEARVMALLKALDGGAGTQNVDRILRLPGTTNIPNKKKLKAGRVVCQTRLIQFNGATCKLDDFPLPEKESPKPKEPPPIGKVPEDIRMLPVSDRIKDLIRGIDDPLYPYSGRSERSQAVLVAMAYAGCGANQMQAVMMDASLPIGQHIRDQPNVMTYLSKQIIRAQRYAAAPEIEELNKIYAVIIVGDKTMIMKSSDDGSFVFMAYSAFNTWLKNKKFTIKISSEKDKVITLSEYWMSHPQRLQYEGLVFAPKKETPGYFNLWRGFSVEPKPGDCSKFLAHLKDNACRGDDDIYQWVVGWWAEIVQKPDKKSGSSLVIKGGQGTGKTKIGQVFGSLFPDHYVRVADPRYVTGRFNSHLVSCLVLHADEGFWAGDKEAEGKLKDLVTGDGHWVEYKGKEAIRVANFIRLFITGNPDWIVPAGFGERRWGVLEIGEDHKEDHAYFAAIDEEMDNGGREALLDHLLKFDLKKVNLRQIPITMALLEQKIASLPADKAWWLDTLMRGGLPLIKKEDAPLWSCHKQALFDRYSNHAKAQGGARRSIETQIGMFLNKHVPGLINTEGKYRFPELSECRKAFDKLLGQPQEWSDPQEWEIEKL